MKSDGVRSAIATIRCRSRNIRSVTLKHTSSDRLWSSATRLALGISPDAACAAKPRSAFRLLVRALLARASRQRPRRGSIQAAWRVW
jgi:hypothetical protein